MKTVTKSYLMDASMEEVFDAFTNPATMEIWSGAPVIMDLRPGTEFSLWGGSISGTNLEVSRDKIVQHWYDETGWDEPSLCTFMFKDSPEGVKVELVHENIPDESAADIDDGWDTYYLGPMKEMLESDQEN